MPTLILCTTSTVYIDMLKPHLHQRSKVPNKSSYTFTDSLTVPSCIHIDLNTLQPMNYFKRCPQATSTPIINQIYSLILQMVEKTTPPTTNAQLPASSYIFLAFMSVGQPKPNHILHTIQQNQSQEPSTCIPKFSNEYDPPLKTLASNSMMIQLPYTRTVDLQLIL